MHNNSLTVGSSGTGLAAFARDSQASTLEDPCYNLKVNPLLRAIFNQYHLRYIRELLLLCFSNYLGFLVLFV